MFFEVYLFSFSTAYALDSEIKLLRNKTKLFYFKKMVSKRNQNVSIAPGLLKDLWKNEFSGTMLIITTCHTLTSYLFLCLFFIYYSQWNRFSFVGFSSSQKNLINSKLSLDLTDLAMSKGQLAFIFNFGETEKNVYNGVVTCCM